MLSRYRRHAVVVALLGLTALLGLGIQSRAAFTPRVPSLAAATARGDWRIVATYPPVGWSGQIYGTWLLQDRQGNEAQLYVASTGQIQKVVHWSGELGYEGAGYLAQQRARATLRLADGSSAPISQAVMTHLSDSELVESAVVSPNWIMANSTDDLLRTGWEVLRGTGGPYYLVRLSTPYAQSGGTLPLPGATLLKPLLGSLQAQARASTR